MIQYTAVQQMGYTNRPERAPPFAVFPELSPNSRSHHSLSCFLSQLFAKGQKSLQCGPPAALSVSRIHAPGQPTNFFQ